MNLLDWILLIVVGMYALSGYWQGFVTGAFATFGLILGGLIGIWLAPKLLGSSGPSVWVSIGAVFVMIVAASIGQAGLQWVGARLRDSITWQPIRAVDAVGGAVLAALAVLVGSWALGTAISGSRLGALTPLVRESSILRTVNTALPEGAGQLMRSFNDVVASSSFPTYLEPFAPERIVAVKPGPERIAKDRQVNRAERAILKVQGRNSCGRGVEGTGFLYANNRLMTNAHVVAGVAEPEVLFSDGRSKPAVVVYYNSDLDIAVLGFDDGRRPALRFADARAKAPVAIVGYPENGPFTIEPGRVRSVQKLRSPDIYGNGSVLREVLSLRGEVLPGNSGGPVLNRDGAVVGVVFAASVTDPDTGYALTSQAVAQAAAKGVINTKGVATGDCAN